MDNNTQEYTILSNFEHKADALACSSCLLSLNAMSISLAVDACRLRCLLLCFRLFAIVEGFLYALVLVEILQQKRKNEFY